MSVIGGGLPGRPPNTDKFSCILIAKWKQFIKQ